MAEVISVLIGLAILITMGTVAFGIGFVCGQKSSKHSTGGWVRSNCCYLCIEKWKYSLRGELEDHTGQ